ncbi:hypothetical protein GCM10011506_39060 [Marivirga lumbricoides]|uniref:histidine kinase n=1 Tax=Marivirga lumbricoides TaxID=1046115 RepID=A0ABQ1MYN8_9BACT|nr:hypothetical protein GCM10011506_39060 [Marivirga lumbricoides]
MNLQSLVKYNQDLKILLVALGYFLFARIGYFFVFEELYFLPTWPPSGLALAFIVILGRRVWPGITIGALLANILAYWNTSDIAPNSIILLSALIAAVHTLEALLGNFLLKKWIGKSQHFAKTTHVFRFLFIALIISVVSALIGTSILYLQGMFGVSEYLQRFISWWVGNLVGILLFTPFILSFREELTWKISKANIIELTFLIIAVSTITFILNNENLRTPLEQAIPFLVLPFLLWLAFRFHLGVAMAGTILVALLAVYLTTHDIGPFVLEDSSNAMLLLQIFIGVISVSTIVLYATEKERTNTQKALEQLNGSLEEKVKIRTEELEMENANRKSTEKALQASNIELRKINSELDNFVYRVSHDLRAPIASMLGLLNLAKKDTNEEMKNLYLTKVEESAKLQDNFITEILDQSRNARLEVKKEIIKFDKIINDTFEQLKYANPDDLVKKNLSIKADKPFISDEWRLKVIMNNLISNAIRYRNGREPIIDINVKIENEQAFITIQDNGRGIGAEHIKKVYDMFYRATDENAGSGLGLYIVKETIAKLKGDIQIESQVGKGTLVTLKLPSLQ